MSPAIPVLALSGAVKSASGTAQLYLVLRGTPQHVASGSALAGDDLKGLV